MAISTRRKGDSPIVAEAMAIMDAAVKEPTIDRYLDRVPSENTDRDYLELSHILRRQREQFITAEAKRRSGEKEETENENENIEGTT